MNSKGLFFISIASIATSVKVCDYVPVPKLFDMKRYDPIGSFSMCRPLSKRSSAPTHVNDLRPDDIGVSESASKLLN